MITGLLTSLTTATDYAFDRLPRVTQEGDIFAPKIKEDFRHTPENARDLGNAKNIELDFRAYQLKIDKETSSSDTPFYGRGISTITEKYALSLSNHPNEATITFLTTMFPIVFIPLRLGSDRCFSLNLRQPKGGSLSRSV